MEIETFKNEKSLISVVIVYRSILFYYLLHR